jgi:protein-ribulosamine 3-kinase
VQILTPENCWHLHLTSLAIARMFGGIPESFYTAYHEHHPKTEPVEEYELRGDLYELFHYLNHTVIFGVRVYFACINPGCD